MKPCCRICPMKYFCGVGSDGPAEEELRAQRVISNRHTGEIRAIKEALAADGITVAGSVYVEGQRHGID